MALSMAVIGAGPGGYQAAVRAAQLGAKVTLIEAAGLGGTCLHWGCIPSKTLLASAKALIMARRLGELGIQSPGEPRPDLMAMQARKAKVIATQEQGLERLFAAHGIELVRGRAKLAPGRKVEVALNDGGSLELQPDRVILALGSAPAYPPGLEPDGAVIIGSSQALALEELPARLAVVGGGVIGCELAGLYAALGSQVTVIEALERLLPLPGLDPATTKVVEREFKKQKVKLHIGMMVEGWQAEGNGAGLELAPSPLVEHKRPPQPATITADKVLVAVGRKPCHEGLGLEAAGVELDDKGWVKADASLATSAEGVYAVGDMLGPARPMLAHLAGEEGMAAAANALGGDERVPYAVVPAVAFTLPEVAWVGISLAQAREQGLEAVDTEFSLRGLGQSQALGELAGQCRLVCQAGDGKLLGAQIMGQHAAEMIHECALAMSLGATASDLARTIHAHPTLSEAVREAAEAFSGRAVHLPPPRR